MSRAAEKTFERAFARFADKDIRAPSANLVKTENRVALLQLAKALQHMEFGRQRLFLVMLNYDDPVIV
jgi:hypothetical protein